MADAAFVYVPPPQPTNQDEQRDSEVHWAKNGNQWYVVVKLHVGADVTSGLVHTVSVMLPKSPSGSEWLSLGQNLNIEGYSGRMKWVDTAYWLRAIRLEQGGMFASPLGVSILMTKTSARSLEAPSVEGYCEDSDF